MAIDNQFGKGIGLAAGFDLGAQKPLDSRLAVNTIAERDAHVTENRAFEGMIVFVDETKKNYQLVNGEWVELLKAEQDRLAALETQLNGGEGAEGGALSTLQKNIDAVAARLNQGGDIEGRIAQNESDIDRIDGVIGQASVSANPEEGIEGVQATGLHKKIEDTAAELRTEILGAIGSADNAVAGEESRAKGEEARIEGKVDQEVLDRKAADEALGKRIDAANQALAEQLDPSKEGSLKKQLDAEIARAQKAESDIQKALDAEEERAGLAEEGLQAAIDAIKDVDNGILAQAKALDKVDRDAQKLVDDAQDERIKALEDANKEGGAVKEAIDQVQANLDAFEQAQEAKNGELDAEDQRLDQAIQDEASRADAAEKKIIQDLANEIARADAAEKANAKAIEDEASRADTEEKRIVGLVEAEAERAAGQEAAIRQEMETEAARVNQKIADDIATESALRVAEEGKIRQELADAIAKEVDDRNAAVLVEKQRAVAEEGKLQAAIEKEVEDREAAVSGEATARQQADSALDNRLKAVEASIGDGGDLEKRVEANEAAIEVINGTGEGSIKKAISDLIDGAPEATNTLNELAQAIKDNKDVYDGWVATHEQAMAQMKSDLQAEIDADVLVESNRAKAEEADIRADFAAADATLKSELQAEIDADVKVEKERAEAEEAAIREELEAAINKEVEDRNAAILVETQRAQGQEAAIRQELADEKKALQDEIDADVKVVADELAKQKDASQDGTLANLIADEAARAEQAEQGLQTNINNEASARQQADSALDGRLQAVEESLGMGEGKEGIASRVEDLEEAIGKAAVPGSDEDPDGEAATGLHKVIDDKIAVLNGEVNSALDGLEKNVAAEKERAEKEEARIAGLVSTEKTRAEGEEARIEGLVTAEAQRAAAAEKANADAIDALELALGAHLTAVSCGDNTVYTDLPSLTPPQA